MILVESLAGGSAGDYHLHESPDEPQLTVRHYEIGMPALVLGSSQPYTDVDEDKCAYRGVEVVRRRSGGGAVLLVPGEHVWVDVWLPRGHRLWDDDVNRSSLWLGDAWVVTLGVALRGLEVHRDRLVGNAWSKKVCFSGRGPGEVFDDRGRKVVGISQRRDRAWARFQCIVSLSWNGRLLRELLAEPKPSAEDVNDWGFEFEAGTPVPTATELASAFVTQARQLS